MKRHQHKRLRLQTDTMRILGEGALQAVAGGHTISGDTCPTSVRLAAACQSQFVSDCASC